MPKEKIFSKLKYIDYNNLLEQVLEKKDFPSMGKNLILSILYKMETNYSDYKTVKRDVEEKEEILQNFIDTVNNNCKNLIIIKPESKKSDILKNIDSNYIANINKKELEVFPHEIYILEGLYSLKYNVKMVDEKYGILKEAIIEVLQKGNSCNNVELLRDFYGFSWYITPNEFEDVYSNLIYQNIRIIAGNDLIKKWLQNEDDKIDYIEELKKELNRRYDNQIAQQIFEQIFITILKIYLEKHPEKIREMQNNNTIKPKQNLTKYLEEVSKNKKKILKQLDKLDRCINDIENLKNELNERRQAGIQISSIKELKEVLIEERKKCIEKIAEYNKEIDPRQFMKKNNAVKKVELFNYNAISESKTTAFEELIKLQRLFLKGYAILAKKLIGKKEIIELIYEFRYYNLIPITNNEQIKDNKELKEDVNYMRELLIDKALKEKIINSVNSNSFINKEVLKNIFSLRIINLENAEVYMQKKADGIKINYLEGDLQETTKDLIIAEDIGKYKIREKKKIKIFS